jgi:hypothetical protein
VNARERLEKAKRAVKDAALELEALSSTLHGENYKLPAASANRLAQRQREVEADLKLRLGPWANRYDEGD